MGERRKMLVLGSSVAAGRNCEPETEGWAHQLARALGPRGVDTVNMAVPGTNVTHWAQELDSEAGGVLADADIVVLSLSLGNEGLAATETEAEATGLAGRYAEGYRGLAQAARRRMRPGARLVLGGPYPNGGYSDFHLQALKTVYDVAHGWSEVDYFIDFLASPLHDGCGKWGPGLMSDEGHPNEEGHKCMHDCVDVARVLGA
mmetsp:Transcript_125967/g.352714  ORF Transcript_125967/g.352714 Transcript_125967/m.352714 type:complete len:203 (+) Transcript_125967:91-699(+)